MIMIVALNHDNLEKKITAHVSNFAIITKSRYVFAWSITYHGKNISPITFTLVKYWASRRHDIPPFPPVHMDF